MAAEYIGLCAACGREFKVDAGKGFLLAKHGYKRSWHREIGRCPGTFRLPHELSPELAEEVKVALVEELKYLRERLRKLRAGEVRSISVESTLDKTKTINLTPADGDRFDRAIRKDIAKTENSIGQIEFEIERVDRLLKNWHQQPLKQVVAEKKEAKPQFCIRCKKMKPRSELMLMPGGMVRRYACKSGSCEPDRDPAMAEIYKDYVKLARDNGVTRVLTYDSFERRILYETKRLERLYPGKPTRVSMGAFESGGVTIVEVGVVLA